MSFQQIDLEVLRIVMRTEHKVDLISDRVSKMSEREQRPAWTPRDYMMAGAGIAMLFAAVTEKAGWTTVITALTRLYGSR